MHEFFKLARIEPLPQRLEHRAGHRYRIQWELWRQFCRDVMGKFFDVAVFCRCSRYAPAFIIKAAYQHWKLSAEMNGYLRGQPVTQRMQHRPQCNVGIVAIKLELLSNGLEPDVGLLNGVVEDREA